MVTSRIVLESLPATSMAWMSVPDAFINVCRAFDLPEDPVFT